MKYVFVFCFLLSSTMLFAQSKVEQSLVQSLEKLKAAMIAADQTSLQQLVSDSLSYGHSSGRTENKSAFIENIINGKSDFVSIDISEQSISIYKNTATVRHVFNAVTNDNAVPGNVKLNVLQVWIKEKKAWKLIARQSVKIF
jgi:hypothetical protein